MTLLAPVFLLIGVAAAALVVIAHLITRHRPPRTPLPTARFVPESPVRITARSYRLSDRRLLALRALVPLAAGAALAGPVIAPSPRPLVRVILADVSGHVADTIEVRDSVRALVREGDVVIGFDSVAYVAHVTGHDSLPALRPGRSSGSISTALVAGFRAAARLRDGADSVEVVLVSPLAAPQVDAATLDVRALHAGRIRHVPVAGAPAEVLGAPVLVSAERDDPLLASIELLGVAGTGGGAYEPQAPRSYEARVVRSDVTAADSSWVGEAGAGRARVLVHWPRADSAHRPASDTAHALVTPSGAVIATFAPAPDRPPPAGVHTVARWGNGVPAATEQPILDGGSCLRRVAVPVPAAGDLVLRPAFLDFVSAMLAPCHGPRDDAPAEPELLQQIVGEGSLIATSMFSRENHRSPLTPWLLGVALVALVSELLVRRRT